MGAVIDEVRRALSGVIDPVVRTVRGADAIIVRGMQAADLSSAAQQSVLLLGWSVLVFLLLCLLEGWVRLAFLVFVALVLAQAYGVLT